MEPPSPLSFPHLAQLAARVERAGFAVRGAIHPPAGEALSEHPLPDIGGAPPSTIVFLGNVGPAMWEAFQRARDEDPSLAGLDDWTRDVVSSLAAELGARPLFPFDGPPYWPFQRWAQLAEPVYPSPLGVLIHPTYGLWHAYRAALLFAQRIGIEPPRRAAAPSPCDACAERPCLRACPAGAFSPAGYDVPACVAHLRSAPEPACITSSCLARRACPVGHDYIYPAPQREHHMRAFLRVWSGPPTIG